MSRHAVTELAVASSLLHRTSQLPDRLRSKHPECSLERVRCDCHPVGISSGQSYVERAKQLGLVFFEY